MINPNKTLTQKALAGALFLRMHAKAMADDDDFFVALMSEPHAVAASAIEQLVKENEKLRAQLVAFQKAANPAVAVDLASGPDTTACYTPFVTGTRVCLKTNPDQRGTVVGSSISSCTEHRYYVRFDSEFEDNRWVKAKHLELIPQ
ncbi:hypothetical protein ID436_003150 [Salmonella enterica]|uniref:Uncharacterized protein n=1 Tax=Salmonella enterica TaxID=28901 RepID=A0A5U0H610_SALER|nr:hypothetical protein [Salmonella enterica]ECI0428912.1 hypothetical protein [Salmonella enterica subsp. enterica serovar Soumbedioune]ECS4146921.1 hypothetical protein [Salmonella enterica subsp. enterica serovar Urbana]ECS7964268.1 hypothetical protein [Salmonella enterica subsp. enterica serovar Poona]EDT3129846.1 hypothetical protein [Salmonella enterica subsp. enterica]EDU7665701.1 hypothetical protein [Salmonella enterica subsp. enterica serovar Glostrup]EED3673659.1 hypothetical prot